MSQGSYFAQKLLCLVRARCHVPNACALWPDPEGDRDARNAYMWGLLPSSFLEKNPTLSCKEKVGVIRGQIGGRLDTEPHYPTSQLFHFCSWFETGSRSSQAIAPTVRSCHGDYQITSGLGRTGNEQVTPGKVQLKKHSLGSSGPIPLEVLSSRGVLRIVSLSSLAAFYFWNN